LTRPFGITAFFWGLQGVHLIENGTIASGLRPILTAEFLLGNAAITLLAGLVGAVLGGLGTLLSELLRLRR
jgi:hypothetical protein